MNDMENKTGTPLAAKPVAKAKHEPLIHITKRNNVTPLYSIGLRAAAIACSVLVMFILILILANEKPTVILKTMMEGLFGNVMRVWKLFGNTAILLGVALALTPAFKMKFWNCGGEGQIMIGSLCAAAVMFFWGESLSLPVLTLVILIASVAAGAIWGVIPALFKAKWNTNETLFTLMMNYIALQLVKFFLKMYGNSQGNLEPMLSYALPKIFDGQYFLNIVVVAVICAIMYVYLRYSKHGYEISVVGESEKTARYIGINVPKVIIRTMLVSGGLCGLIGMLLVSNGSCSVTTTITGGQGFTAILVSWLGKFNPLYMILTSFLVIFLEQGTSYMGDICRLDTSMADIFIGVVLLFIIGCEFFINYKINFRKKAHAENEKKEEIA